MNTLRTFVAVEISPEVRGATLRLIERLRVASAKVTWVKADNLHFTLKFLGDVPATQTVEICRAVQEAVAPFTPFEVVAQGVGAFPSVSRPHTLWLGVRDGAEQLELVFQATERLLTDLGFPREARRYTPHLTLGRVREGGGRSASGGAATKALSELLLKHAEFDAGAMTIDSVAIVSSTLSRDGPAYEVLARAGFQE